MPYHTAFVFAHPGHEFRLMEFIRSNNSTVHIFTHGSRAAVSSARIEASAKLNRSLGAQKGNVFGAYSDRVFYTALLNQDFSFFETIIDQLSIAFEQDGTDQVVTDAWQNYNPIHDIAHICARMAAARTLARTGAKITVYDYPVVLGELAHAPCGPAIQRRHLSPESISFKQQLLAAYPDIADDASALIAIAGNDALSIESLHRLLPLSDLFPTVTAPYYEQYGKTRVASGAYTQLITWAHVQAIVNYLLHDHPETKPLQMALEKN